MAKKYIDADKLKYEIERRKLSNYYTDTDDYEAELFEIIDFLQQEQQEDPDKSLEEAAEDAVCMAFGGDPAYYGNKAEFSVNECMRLFIAGAEWQKQQMLKDAYVESQIVEDGRIELEGDPLPCLNPIILLPYPQFKPDDKVRIVVLKAEEE